MQTYTALIDRTRLRQWGENGMKKKFYQKPRAHWSLQTLCSTAITSIHFQQGADKWISLEGGGGGGRSAHKIMCLHIMSLLARSRKSIMSKVKYLPWSCKGLYALSLYVIWTLSLNIVIQNWLQKHNYHIYWGVGHLFRPPPPIRHCSVVGYDNWTAIRFLEWTTCSAHCVLSPHFLEHAS